MIARERQQENNTGGKWTVLCKVKPMEEQLRNTQRNNMMQSAWYS